ncbi:MAG: efflux RND transporter periplasmic adaptor subunit [Aquificae bacterium]|nr:efflux RND transporter periplasmic adaptor subunit [Aquificota bacterium]
MRLLPILVIVLFLVLEGRRLSSEEVSGAHTHHHGASHTAQSRGEHLMIGPERVQMIGIVTEEVKRRKLVKRFPAVGYLEYDPSRVYDITMRAEAWVEETFGRFEGEFVKRGTPLMRVLSPGVEIARKELELARKLGDEELIKKTEEKLRYLKEGRVVRSPVSGVILEKRVHEGGYLREGQLAYRIVDLSAVWAILEIPLKQAPYVKAGTPVFITPEDSPELTLKGEVDYIFPLVKRETRTLRVRVKLKNPNYALRPNTLVEALFEVPLGEVLAVPESAVVDTGRRKVVFLEVKRGMYRPVRVELGRRAEGYYEVKEGLREGDRVVVRGTFFLDAEAQLRGLYGTPAAGGHHH